MLTMTSALDRAERQFAARAAIIDRERNFTWGQHIERVSQAAGMLAGLGLGAGERFGVICENSYRYMELLHAGYWAGVIPVPINHRLAPPEIRHILDDADIKYLFLGQDYLELPGTEDVAPWREHIVYIGPRQSKCAFEQYEDLIGRSQPSAPKDADDEDLALLLYTGGTTGKSKGVRLSHRNLVSNGMQVNMAMGVRADDRFLHIAPMFHAADLLATSHTLSGGCHSFLPNFGAEELLKALQGYEITIAFLAPTMIIMTLQNPNFDDYDLSKFRLLFYGSSPMAAEWVERSIERFKGTEIQQGYGLTETSPILTTLDPIDHKLAIETGNIDILRAAGRSVVGVDLAIMDDDGNRVPDGDAGEVAVRGPNVTAGYLNRPDANEAAFRDGWFLTGDFGRVDENGVLFLLDRKKDMVITGGENVYTSEVEAALYQHPDVHEAAVIGVPDKKFGEALFAVIVPAPGKKLVASEIIEHCRGKIGGYKIPRQMDFVEKMPKSAMGKILKTELREIYGKT
ncbi:MAG: AMP-binding protein [Rhodospirillales bacterium]|nr:AMP-binding protein [Rhodospirillales bacterium]